ncbi:MAG: pitrilysin family protein [Planctomycetaceae bacterium]
MIGHGRRLVAPLLLALLAVPASARSADDASAESGKHPGVTHVRTIEGISEYRLDNGLQVLLFPDPSKPTVTVNSTIFVGSRHEGYGETGMAHLLEHLLFKGTPDHPAIPKSLQERGARFNGTTWVDRTNYYETLPASEENLEFAVRLEADRLVNSYVRKEDLDSEMTVVRNEFEMGENEPSRILGQRMMATAYEWHNYGKSTIGNRADIERVPIDNLKAFYQRFYRPENSMLVVAGNFDPEKALAVIADAYGKLKNPDEPLPATYTEEPPQDGERVVMLRRVGKLSLVGAMYHIPAGSDPSYPSIDVLESILTSAPSGRLYKALVEAKLAASVAGAAFALHDPGIVRFMAEVNTGNDAQTVLTKMIEVIESVGETGVTAEEVDRAKRKLLKQRELSAADSTEIAVELSEWAAMGDWRLYFLYRDRLEKVTPESVTAAAKDYFRRNNRTVGLFLPTEQPQSVPVPQPATNLAEVIGDYKGRDDLAVGEAFDVSPQNIQQRTGRSELPGGLKVALLEKQNRGNSVVVRLNVRYGNEDVLTGKATAAEFLPRLMARGTTSKTRQEIQDELDRLGARLTAGGTPGVATFAIQAKQETLLEVLALLAEILRHTSLPADELELLKQADVATYESELTEPQSLATTTVRRTIAPYEKGDPRYVMTLPEQIDAIKAVTQEDVKALYDELLNGRHGEIAIVGTFEKDAVFATIEKAFADWTSDVQYARLPQLVPDDLDGRTESIATPGKKNAVYFSATAFPLSSSHPDYAALVIGNYILGGGSLSSRLADRVRQQEGLSYGVLSGFSAQNLDKRAVMYLYAITNPENMEKLRSVIREEFDRLLNEGVTDEELAAAKQGYLQKQQVNRADDATLAQTLAENLEADRTMSFYADLENQITALTPDQVVDALRKHIDPEKFVLVVAGDFEKSEDGE